MLDTFSKFLSLEYDADDLEKTARDSKAWVGMPGRGEL